MNITWISQLGRAIVAPSIANRYWNAIIGIILVPIIQLVLAPFQMGLDSRGISLPASILLMIFVTIIMLLVDSFHGGAHYFYNHHMKGPTDFLGRHMSFGFMASFVMLSKDHIKSFTDVPRIAGAFIFTTLLSYIGSFLFAVGSCKIEQRLRGIRQRAKDVENDTEDDLKSSSRSNLKPSHTSEISTVIVRNEPFIPFTKLSAPSPTVKPISQTAPIWIAFSLLISIGVPIYCTTGYDMPFETFCFIFVWVSSVHFQRFIKSCKLLELRPRTRSFLAVIFNPVLMTSALGTAYFWTKTAVTHRNIADILACFKRHNSWADLVVAIGNGGSFEQNIGAGDLANALLDAGIVSLGFKMFEYRRELWSSFATVFSTSLVFATVNIFLNVIFARTMGLQPADALAFCARNVTIALGVPAVQKLDGSTTLMSALVTFSGMLFQIIGGYLFVWLGINDRVLPPVTSVLSDSEKGADEQEGSDCKVIAAGVTVGINAAAMGTAHLIERDSKCTAYSALSMTVFGALTVALTAVPAIADVLKALSAR